jgi:hypothetical protein
MRNAILLLLLLAVSASAERYVVQFRLKKAPDENERGFALDITEEGFWFERFGGRRRVHIPWNALVDEDATRLRRKFQLEWVEDAEPELVSGHVLHFKGGGEQSGLLLRVDETGRHWLKSEGVDLPYPGDRIARVEELDVPETLVYSKGEIYHRRLTRHPPATASGHRALADYMYDIGSWSEARAHYGLAVESRPEWSAKLASRLEEIDTIMADEEASRVLGKAKARANLDGDYAGAIAMVEEYIAGKPDARRRGAYVLDQIREHQETKLRTRFHRVKHQEFDRAIERFLLRTKPDLSTAIAWLREELEAELARRIQRRLGLREEDYERLRATRFRGAPHFATYWMGSFIISKRAKVGSGASGVSGDPESWWAHYDNVATRSSWMKAYAAERMPGLFEVVQIRTTSCERCGGKGVTRQFSFRSIGAGRHQWLETCKRCYGARDDRGVAYR